MRRNKYNTWIIIQLLLFDKQQQSLENIVKIWSALIFFQFLFLIKIQVHTSFREKNAHLLVRSLLYDTEIVPLFKSKLLTLRTRCD